MRLIHLVRLRFRHAIVEVNETDQVAVTIFPDGSRSPAAPNLDAESVARALELGYANTWEMTREHEVGHAVLFAGVSPTVWADAHDGMPREKPDLWWMDEAAVLAWQRVRVAALGVAGSWQRLLDDHDAEYSVARVP